MAEDTRSRLLAATIDHVVAHGISDLSLRRLAAAIGTSHRMLVYHFGSKEGLLIAVAQAAEARQLEVVKEIGSLADLSPADQLRRMWRTVADPALWPNERLFFELYGQALQGRPHTAPFLDGIVESWLGPGTELGVRNGLSPEDARAFARAGLALVRGLLLDLLATGDRAGVDAAMEAFIASL